MTMNFIFVLLIIATKLDVIFIVTCKFIKKILLIIEKKHVFDKIMSKHFFITILEYD